MRYALAIALGVVITSASGAPATDRSVRVSAADHRALGPEIAIGRDGAINIIWLDKGVIGAPPDPSRTPQNAGHGHSHQSWTDVYFARSTDGGRTFSAPVRVNHEQGEVWGFAASRPRIGIGPSGTIHVFYPANETSPATGKPVAVSRFVRSTDNGRTFSKAVRLNSHATTDASAFVHGGLSHAHAFGTMSVARDGTIYTYWIDTRAMAKDGDNGMMFSAISRDDGASFTPDAEVFPADICPCCQITAAAIDRDTVFVGARQVHGDNLRDATIARSDDGGKSFGTRVRLGGKPWRINGCPLKPTAIAVDGDFVYAAAHNGADEPAGVHFAWSRDSGKTFTDYQPVHPQATVSDSPVVAVSRNTVIVAWHAKTSEGRRIYYRTSSDRGVTLTPVQEAATPTGTASSPALAVASDGAVHMVWQQDDAIRTMKLDLPQTRVAGPDAPTPEVPLISAAQFEKEMTALRGNVVIVNLWATWCTPCLKEIPVLVQLAGELAAKGVKLVGVAMDDPTERLTSVQPFHRKYFPTFRTWQRAESDMDALVSVVDPAWNEVLPTTYIVGRDGKLAQRLQGIRSYEEFRSAVVPLAR